MNGDLQVFSDVDEGGLDSSGGEGRHESVESDKSKVHEFLLFISILTYFSK